MSKRAYMGLALLLALCLPVAALYVFEKYTENTIRQSLTQHGISMDSVDYSLLNSSLEIQNLSGAPLHGMSFSIDSIKALKPNLKAFDPHGEEYPLVAQDIYVSQVQTKYTLGQNQFSTHTQSLHLVQWKQNLGNVLASLAQNNIESTFKAGMNMHMAQMQASNIQTVYIQTDQAQTNQAQNKNTITSHTEKYSITQLSPTAIQSYTIEGIRSKQKNPQGHQWLSKVQKIEMGKTDLPSPTFMAYIWHKLQSPALDFDKTFETHLAHYLSTGIQPHIRISNLDMVHEFQDTKTHLCNLKNLDLKAAYTPKQASSIDFSLDIEDLIINFATLNEDKRAEAIVQNMLGTPNILNNIKLTAKLNTKEHTSTFDAHYSVRNLGDAQLHLGFILPIQSFAKDLSGNAWGLLQNLLNTMHIQAIKFNFVDTGLVPRTLISVSKQTALPLEQALPLTLSSIEKELRGLRPLLSENNYTSLQQCIQNPGTTNIQLNLEQPTPLLALAMIAMSAPSQLPLSIQCQAGAPLLDAAKMLR